MKQITEDYVSFETAVLLKEKGFDELCFALYNPEEELIQCGVKLSNTQVGRVPGSYSAPTQSLALKWLREVHKLHIFAKPYWPQGDMRNKMSWQGFIVDLNTINDDSQCYTDSYEEAIENCIRFALENLI